MERGREEELSSSRQDGKLRWLSWWRWWFELRVVGVGFENR